MSLPQGWIDTKIGSFVKFQGGSQPPAKTFKFEDLPGYIRFIQIRDYKSEEHKTYIPSALARTLCQSDDVMIGRYGPPVFQILRGLKGSYNVALIKATPLQGLTKDFLFLVLSQDELFRLIDGLSRRSSGQSGVDMSALKSFKLLLPPLAEQIEIARVLTAWDDAIARMSALIAAKTRFKTALMGELLTGERRFEEFKGQAWRLRKLGDVARLTLRPVVWNNDEIYRLASVRRNSGGLFSRESLAGRDIKVKKLHTIREGDFLISHIQAAYGAMGRVPSEFDGTQVSEMYSILTPCAPGSIDIGFLDYLSQLPLMHHKVLHSSNGFFAERLRLNFDPIEFMKQTFTLPTIEEQRAIAQVLDAANGEISALNRQLLAFKTQKRALMQLLLSGEKRVAAAAHGTSSDGAHSDTGGES